MAAPSPDKLKSKLKRAGRKRRLTGWTLIALGLLVAGVWGASGWWTIRFGADYWVLDLVKRHARLNRSSIVHANVQRGWQFNWIGDDTRRGWWWWWYGWRPNGQDYYGVIMREKDWNAPWGVEKNSAVMLWPIPFLVWAAGVPVLRSGIVARRRAVTGSCGKCGYSLAGLGEGAPCPECGKASTAGAVSTPPSGS